MTSPSTLHFVCVSPRSLYKLYGDIPLCNGLISTLGLLTAREEPVDDDTDDREDEDQDTPKDLVRDWSVGLEDLNYARY